MLPATDKLLRSFRLTGGQRRRVVIIQHLLPDTEEFIHLLSVHGFHLECVIAIPYSVNRAVLGRLRESGIRVYLPTSTSMVEEVFELLSGAARLADEAFLLHEVGGYCAPLAGLGAELRALGCFGVVEETKQGLWRYRDRAPLSLPVVQIADSELKRIESLDVGIAVANALEDDLRTLESTLSGLSVLVLGYGDIGSGVAAALRTRGAIVAVYDTRAVRQIAALAAGFKTGKRDELVHSSNLIVGASGQRSLSAEDFADLQHGVLLASASSRRLELPIDELEVGATRLRQFTAHLTEAVLPSGKAVFYSDGGYPVNFRGISLTSRLADLMFCQVAAGLVRSLSETLEPGIHDLGEWQDRVAEMWWHAHEPG